MATDWTTASDTDIEAADLIIELGLASLPDEEQARMLTRMSETVEEATLLAAIARLTDEQRATFEAIVARDDADATKTYLVQHVPDLPNIAAAELLRYKRVMLTGLVAA